MAKVKFYELQFTSIAVLIAIRNEQMMIVKNSIGSRSKVTMVKTNKHFTNN